MTILQIRYFMRTYETGSAQAAAQELFLTRTAVSKAIRELETEFGTKLFERTNLGLVPTAAADLLYQKGMDLVRYLEETGSAMRDISRRTEEVVRLGLSPITGMAIFSQVYGPFVRAHPGIRILPVECGKAKAQAMMESGEMDLCFTTYAETFPDSKGNLHISGTLGSAPLYDTELVLCVGQDHRLAQVSSVSAEDIRDESFVFFKRPLQWEAEIEHRFGEAGFLPHVFCRSAHPQMICTLLRSGTLATIQLRGTLDTTELAEIPLRPASRYVNAVIWNRANTAKAGVNSFLTFCRTFSYPQLN